MTYKSKSGIVATLAGALVGVVPLILFGGVVYWLAGRINPVNFPYTETPETEWVPAVNAAEVEGGAYAPGLFKAELPDGTTCYVAIGIFSDDLECVR